MAKNHVNVEEVAQEKSFLEKNWKQCCIALGVVLVVIFGYIGYVKLISEPRETAASDAIAECQTLIAQGEYAKADSLLTTFVDQYGSTKAGNLAQAYLGIAKYNEGMYAEAIKALEKFDANDADIAAEATAALGNCYACDKQNEKAVKTLTKAAGMTENQTLKAMYLVQAGEIAELALGQKEEALKLYQEVKDNCKMSNLSNDIDKYIERAKN